MGLFYPALQRATNANGAPKANYKWYFYLEGTTTPTQVYSDADLGTSLGGNITSNAAGLFNSGNGIYLSEAINTRAVLKDDLGNTLQDIPFANNAVSAGPVVTPQQFGAVGDNATNDGPAFLAALAYLKSVAQPAGFGYGRGAPSMFVPAGIYYLGTDTLDVDFTCRVSGEGTGLPGGGASVLRWAAGATGIRVQAYNTSGADQVAAPEMDNITGSGCIFEGLYLKGGYAGSGVEAEEHGFHLRAMALIRDCTISHFRGNGIHVQAAVGTGAPLEGNANLTRLDNVSVSHCRNGIYFDSADANACTVTHANVNANRQWGIYDSSFLGNTYVGCHSAANGWDGALGAIPTACTYSGNRYYVKPGQAVGSSTNPPTGTTSDNTWWGYIGAGGTYNGVVSWVSGTTFREGGAYFTDDVSACNVFLGCYSEADQNPTFAVSPTLFLGGLTGPISGNASSLQSYQGTIGSPQGFRAVSAAGNTVGIISSGIQFNHATNGDYSLVYNGADLAWTYANSGTPTNWAFRLTGEGTASAVGSRRIDFPNGFGLADKKVLSGTAAPTTGTYAVGDMVFNSAPAAGGVPGWTCVSAGTPGTWKAWAALDA